MKSTSFSGTPGGNVDVPPDAGEGMSTPPPEPPSGSTMGVPSPDVPPAVQLRAPPKQAPARHAPSTSLTDPAPDDPVVVLVKESLTIAFMPSRSRWDRSSWPGRSKLGHKFVAWHELPVFGDIPGHGHVCGSQRQRRIQAARST